MKKVQRILFWTDITTSCLQFMARDLAHGFRKLGKDVEIVRQFYQGEPHDPARLANLSAWFNPDVIFLMDWVRSNHPGVWARGPAFVSWLQDSLSHLYDQGAIDGVAEGDFILTSFPGLKDRLVAAGYPEKRLWHVPVAANFDLFYPEWTIPKDFTVGFPCNIGHPATARSEERTNRRADPVHWLIDAGVKVKLWGVGWEKFPWAQPFIEDDLVRNGTDLRAAYGSCSAVLHANSDTNLHQRVFEAHACGRPVLMYGLENDHHPDGILGHDLNAIMRFLDRDGLLAAVEKLKAEPLTMQRALDIRGHARAEEDYLERCRQILAIVEGGN